MWYGSGRRSGLLVIASSVLIDAASGSSDSGERMTIARAVWRLTRSRSARRRDCRTGRRCASARVLHPNPDRRPPSRPCPGRRGRRCSRRGWFSFAAISSLMTVKICWDQPRITMWPDSMTMLRPLRSSSSRDWSAGHQDADQDARDEDADERHGEHRQEERRAGLTARVVADGTRVDRRQDRPPDDVEEVVTGGRGIAQCPDGDGDARPRRPLSPRRDPGSGVRCLAPAGCRRGSGSDRGT